MRHKQLQRAGASVLFLFLCLHLVSSDVRIYPVTPLTTEPRSKYEVVKHSIEQAADSLMDYRWPPMLWKLCDIQIQDGTSGAIGEIDIQNGKFFGALFGCAKSFEPLWAFGTFKDTSSPHAAMMTTEVFQSKMKEIAPSKSVKILDGMPNAEAILRAVGRSKLISIDGGHSADRIFHDLVVAQHALADKGLIILDDMMNTNRLSVLSGHLKFVQHQKAIKPLLFYIFKLVYCEAKHLEWWQAKLRSTLPIAPFDSSRRMLFGDDVLIVHSEAKLN